MVQVTDSQRGTGKAEDAKPPGAGIIPKPCPRKWNRNGTRIESLRNIADAWMHARVITADSAARRRQLRLRRNAQEGKNLPETRRTRWGEGLTAEGMKKCVWLRPQLVAQIEFLEWTESDHLRHSKFVALREDKDARRVIKEHAGES
jgi:ATP-dependent DNA ligase